MLIENVDALKQWLVLKLAPICDAEPTALAKYVCALVRKDKPESELRDICNDQLDVFLQQKTKIFVDDLFEGLRSKAYETVIKSQPSISTPNIITPSIATPIVTTPTPTPVPTPTPTPVKIEVKAEAPTLPQPASQSASSSSNQSRTSSGEPCNRRNKKPDENSQPWVSAPVKQEVPENKDTRDGRDIRDARENRDKDIIRDDRDMRDRRDIDRREGDRRDNRDTRDRRRRSRSRSISPRRGREIEERRRRYDERDRGRYSPERRYSPDRRYRRHTRSRSPRRYRPSPERRGRSRSPRERDLREKLNRRSRSWSRHRSRSRSRGCIDPDSRGSTPTQDNGHYPAVVTSNSSLPNLVNLSHTSSEPPPPGEGPPLIIPVPPGVPGAGSAGQTRMRCQSFDEKGFCMLGDLCPFDHGMDPVVVEDIGIPNVLSFPPPPAVCAGHPLPLSSVAGALTIPPVRPVFPPPRMNVPPPGTLIRPPGPPRPLPAIEPYQPEGYNPEAPAMTAPSSRPPFWTTPPPGLPPGPFPLPPRPLTIPPPLQRQRDLVTVQTVPEDDEDKATDAHPSPANVSSRVVVPAKRSHAEMEDGTLRVVQRAHFNPRHGFIAQGPRKPFDFNRLGGFQRQQLRQTNTTLEVRKIPVEFNNIAKLNEHFEKFGILTNIQVKFDGDPGAALITYSKNEEAASAYHSSEPVFNNRFIKLFWHRPSDKTQDDSKPSLNQATSGLEMKNAETNFARGSGIYARLGPVNQPLSEQSSSEYDIVESSSEAVSSTSQDASTKPPISMRHPVIPPAYKMSINNVAKSTATADKSIVYTTSLGNLKKTVFNQQVVKARAAVAPLTSPTAVKTADFVSRIEAIKKNEELKKEAIVRKVELDKQKQVLLEKQLVQQKLLLDKLEKGKATLTLEEKTNIMKMLKVVSDSIDKLKFNSSTPPASKKIAMHGSHKLVRPAATSPLLTATSSSSVAATSVQQTVKKDILDAELDLMTKQGSGEDTAALRLRLVELTQQPQSDPFSFQAASMGLLGRGRGLARGRGPMPWWPGRGRGGRSMSLDKRTKSLEVRGFLLEDLEEVKAHFELFGDIVQVDLKEEVPCAILTFVNRKQAEQAFAGGAKFKKRDLSLRWHMGVVHVNTKADVSADVPAEQTEDADSDEEEEEERKVAISSEVESIELPANMDEVSANMDEVAANADEEILVSYDEDLDERILLAPDEEEEEEDETRSWRR